MSDRFNSPIAPSVGRIVLVRGNAVLVGEPTREVPGLVTRVWGDNCINVQVSNETDGGVFRSSVSYDDDTTATDVYCVWRWMDYQVAQAQKVEAPASEVGASVAEPVAAEVVEPVVEPVVGNDGQVGPGPDAVVQPAEEHVAEGLADHPDDVVQPAPVVVAQEIRTEPVAGTPLTDAEALANQVTDPLAVAGVPGADLVQASGDQAATLVVDPVAAQANLPEPAEPATSAQQLPVSGSFGFGVALDLLEDGHAVAREGWNGKGMFIYRVPADSYPAQTGVAKAYFGEGALVPYGAYLAMKTADGTVVPWLSSQTDTLAKDWMVTPW